MNVINQLVMMPYNEIRYIFLEDGVGAIHQRTLNFTVTLHTSMPKERDKENQGCTFPTEWCRLLDFTNTNLKKYFCRFIGQYLSDFDVILKPLMRAF